MLSTLTLSTPYNDAPLLFIPLALCLQLPQSRAGNNSNI